ncbi:hypothetical protein [Streptomyces sp. NBC_01408]|uniref:hypothetical protein n=1 Tax=Streptomyces sp. NBC_01408 TaxID=2903855 RepID=UPI0022585F44|nr:hypothetical protein [Streptomyces sp. NBC_01408]MCX4695659.1 hypothetical protein [Streptomyces sp. NBC_01408]
MTASLTTDVPQLRLEATHQGRTLTIETVTTSPGEARQRNEVALLRREFGFPLPAPDWESDDENGLVLLCRTDAAAVGTVRVLKHHRGVDGGCPYLTAELRAVLPSDPAGFALVERLVIRPEARSLELVALLMYAAYTWPSAMWDVAEFAAITSPKLVRLFGWLGMRPLSEPMVLPGSDGLGLLVGGRLDEAATRTEALFTTGGWRLSADTEVSAALA